VDSGGEKVRDDGANILVQMRVKASGGVCYLCGINLSIETRLYATLMNAPGPKRPHTALLQASRRSADKLRVYRRVERALELIS